MKEQDKNTQQNKTKLICHGRNGVGTKEDKSGRQWSKAHKGRSSTNLYPANTREVGPRSRGFRGCGLVVGGKGGLYLVSCHDFFWKDILLGWYLTQKK